MIKEKFRLKIESSDRWSGPDRHYEFFDTLDEAKTRKEEINAGLGAGPAPEYYERATDIVLGFMKEGNFYTCVR